LCVSRTQSALATGFWSRRHTPTVSIPIGLVETTRADGGVPVNALARSGDLRRLLGKCRTRLEGGDCMAKVLLVDDERDLAEACAASLSLAGHEVTIAYDGAEALGILTKGSVDLVITDLRMPRIDGFTLLRWIMSHKPNTKVIVMTAFGTAVVSDTAKRLGALQCLNKPVGRAKLVETVASVLKQSGPSAIAPSITVADYVQVCMYTGKTTVFEVSRGKKKGTIAVVDGTVTHVEQGDLSGEHAFFEIISWEGGQINEKKVTAPLTPNVHRGGQSLLLKALRLRDEVKPARQPEAGVPGKEMSPGTTITLGHPSDSSPLHGTDVDAGGERNARQEAIPDIAPAPSGLDGLSEMLNQDAQVAEYGIFVEQDFLRYKRATNGTILSAAPSLCLKLGNLAKEELHCGALRYVFINTAGGAGFMVFDYPNARGVVGLRPGTRPEDLWEKLWRRQLT
jgi:CheY-like chemotaxis protein